MNDNKLPELNLPKIEQKKKKRFLPWLFGNGRGIASAGGGGLGAASVGSSGAVGFWAALLAGKGALALGIALTAMAVGAGLYLNMTDDASPASKAFGKPKSNINVSTQQYYVPAIEREGNKGNSLGNFSGDADNIFGSPAAKDADAKDANKPEEVKEDASAEKPAPDPSADQPADQNARPDMGGSRYGQLSNGFGNSGLGQSKFGPSVGSGMSNQLGNTVKGVGFGGVMGSFQRPAFKNGKSNAMSQGRSVQAHALNAQKKSYGAKAYSQARGIRTAMQSGLNTTNADTMRGSMDQAWEGQTSGGAVGGISTGDGNSSSGVNAPASLSNTSSGATDNTDTTGSSITNPSATDVTPWAGMAQMAMMLLMMANMLVMIAALLANMSKAPFMGWLMGIAKAIAGVAAAMGAMVVVIGMKVSSTYGQSALGNMYAIAGGVTTAAAIMALMGSASPIIPAVMAAVSSLIAMLAAKMAASASAGKTTSS